MVEQLVQRARHLRRWYGTHRHRRAFRLFRGLLTLTILAACGWFIWTQVSAGLTSISAADLRLDPSRVALSWLCTAVATALGAWEWVLLVKALGGKLDLGPGLSVHLTANLFKYLPGSIWPYAGKAYLVTRRGVPSGIASLSIAGELVIVYASGALLMMLCFPLSGIVSWSTGPLVLAQIFGITLTAFLIIGVPAMTRRAVLRWKRSWTETDLWKGVNWPQISFVIAAVLLTWCLLSVGFSILIGHAAPLTWQQLMRNAFALAAALLLGQLAVFAPTGLGVREAVLITLLAGDDTAVLIILLALVFRLEMMIGEVVCALVAVTLDRLHRRGRRGPDQGQSNGHMHKSPSSDQNTTNG